MKHQIERRDGEGEEKKVWNAEKTQTRGSEENAGLFSVQSSCSVGDISYGNLG